MKSLFLGILFIIIVGLGGLVYQNAVQHPLQQIACPLDALVCPDGTSVGRTGTSCVFAECPPPNVTLPAARISFALPEGFSSTTLPDATVLAAYTAPANASSTNDATIAVRDFPIAASSTALATIQQTAINMTSGEPVSATSFTSTLLGTRRFTVVSLERFEGIVTTAYYFARANDVLRFDAVDMNVTNWTSADLDITTLPAHTALTKLLSTLQSQ